MKLHTSKLSILSFFHSIIVNSKKGLSAIMELILFEILHFEGVKDTFLLIAFSFLIDEVVA